MTSNVFRYGEHILLADGREIHLTRTEADILATLARHHGHVVTYETIAAGIWPISADEPDLPRRNIHTQTCHLRAKLESTGLKIETQRGLGARLMGKMEIDGTIR
jgi:DNA-binding response OmpR family regulator